MFSLRSGITTSTAPESPILIIGKADKLGYHWSPNQNHQKNAVFSSRYRVVF